MQIEQARFNLRNLELEIQIKELKPKHQLLTEERELKPKMMTLGPNQPVLETSHHSTGSLDEERCLGLCR